MKTMNKLALGVAALLLAGTSFGQTTATYPTASPTASTRDNPGVLGRSFTDFRYTWVDFREANADPEGYMLGVAANAPISRGLDLGLGYNYYRENGHRNPLTTSSFDVRSHQLSSALTLHGGGPWFKPFARVALGYQWTKGDLQSFRTFDHDWAWGATVGAEIPLGTFALTPRISYSDTFNGDYDGTWHYGAELHHWFNEKTGAFIDVAFHEPRRNIVPNSWTYTAGLRVRF